MIKAKVQILGCFQLVENQTGRGFKRNISDSIINIIKDKLCPFFIPQFFLHFSQA